MNERSETERVQIKLNGSERDVPEHTTVAMLLEHLNLRAQPVAVEVNRELVPRPRHEQHVLAVNDAVEIVTLVGGG